MKDFNTDARRQPTFYFVGVTTQQSSIMRIFPLWMQALGRDEVAIEGVDLPLHAEPQNYRRIVEHIKRDPQSLGGLVTSHKIDLLEASADLFDELAPDAAFLQEVSGISKACGKLWGHASDPAAGGKSLASIVDPGYFSSTGAHLLCFGAGGSAAALAYHLVHLPERSDQPRRMIIVNRSAPRLERLQRKVEALSPNIDFEFVLNENPSQNDRIMGRLPPGSLVVNATGMGKDRPGSPITNDALFPLDGIVWEFNYRGQLDFLHQALAQKESRALRVEDGWIYFLHGWTQVIEHVLHLEIDTEQLARLSEIAASVR